jgi:hypothetical protein
MVSSRLYPDITYDDTEIIDPNDIGYNAVQIEIELFPSIGAIIALGDIRYKYSNQNLIYVPVYIVLNGKTVAQIGVYEFLADKYSGVLDINNDIDIDKISKPLPLFYSFFNETYMKTLLGDKIIRISKPINETDDEDDTVIITEPLSVTTSVEYMNREIMERTKYKSEDSTLWIQKFMKNNSYSLQDNEAGGDCFFAVIRDAMKNNKNKKTVGELRDIVSDAATKEDFDNYKEHYDQYKGEITLLTTSEKDIKDEMSLLKKEMDSVKGRNERKELSIKGRVLEARYGNLVKEKGNAAELSREFKWMEGVIDLDGFKTKIQTSKFWADSWAINILERVLNIKMIIFSSINYEHNDVGNVLQCGDLVDIDILENGKFEPDNYILTSYSGDHYMLITYNNNTLFTFNTIPHTIKQLIVDKCGENDNGIYNLIPDFKEFAQGIKIEGVVESKELPPKDELNDPMPSIDYDSDTVFQFYSKSSGVAKPGKGSGEKICKKNILEYSCLSAIPDWRRVLSNFHMVSVPFELDDMRWASVEHFYQASKFKKDNPDFYYTFSAESGTELSKDSTMAKSAGGKTGKYKGKLIRDKAIKIDADFFTSGEDENAMYRGQEAKYTSDELSRNVLIATKNALLQHYVRGGQAVIFHNTMKIRSSLLN